MARTTEAEQPFLARIEEQHRHALACGALLPIETEAFLVTDGGVDFIVRILGSLPRKAAARTEQTARTVQNGRLSNPFLPFDPDLYIGDAGPSHLCLLNKFNVVNRHVLVVTRRYENQEQLLGAADFRAVWQCLDSLNWLAFYNGGRAAGASQAHKHLQIVPPSIGFRNAPIPIESALPTANKPFGIALDNDLPFRNVLVRLNPLAHGVDAAMAALHAYLDGLEKLGCRRAGNSRQSAPYSLLMTRRWLFLAPRTEECYESVSVNALGFAGSLLVRSAKQLERVRSGGPMSILVHVGKPR